MPSFGKILGAVSKINCVTNGGRDKGEINEPVASLVQKIFFGGEIFFFFEKKIEKKNLEKFCKIFFRFFSNFFELIQGK